MYALKRVAGEMGAALFALVLTASNCGADLLAELRGDYTGFNPSKWSLNGIDVGRDFNSVLNAHPNKWLELKSDDPIIVIFFSVPEGHEAAPRTRVYTKRSGRRLVVQQVEVQVTEADQLYGDIRQMVAVMELLLGQAIHFEGKLYDRLWFDSDLGRAIRIKQIESGSRTTYVVVLSEYKR